MADVYVNLHPTYIYSNIVIQNGYIAELKEYVVSVEWLHWEHGSLKGKKPLLCVMGGWANEEGAVERHLERTKVILQRLQSVGAKIHIRNERNDEWTEYVPDSLFTADEMYEIEVQRLKESDKERWARADIEKYQKWIDVGLEKGIEPEEELMAWFNEAKERLEECMEEEKGRKEKIKNAWCK